MIYMKYVVVIDVKTGLDVVVMEHNIINVIIVHIQLNP